MEALPWAEKVYQERKESKAKERPPSHEQNGAPTQLVLLPKLT
jgi:hypothetical protein